MSFVEKIARFTEDYKSIFWGLFLSAVIMKFAVSNILLATILILTIFHYISEKHFSINKKSYPLFFYFLWALLSLLWTTCTKNTLSGIERLVPFVLVPILVFINKPFTRQEFYQTVRIFGCSLILYFIAGLINAGLHNANQDLFFYHGLVSIFDNNAIYISMFVSCTMLTLLQQKLLRRLDIFLLIVLGIYLLFLSSKIYIITTALLCVISFLIRTKRRYTLLIASLFCSIILLLSVTDNPVKDRFLVESYTDMSMVWDRDDFTNISFSGTEVRGFLMRVFWEMNQNNHIGFFGLGHNNINYLIDQYSDYYNAYEGYFHLNFHNQYIQTYGEIGVFGLVILLFILGANIFNGWKDRNYGLLFVSILFFIGFLSESYLSRQKGILLFVIFLTLLQQLKPDAVVNKRKKIKNRH